MTTITPSHNSPVNPSALAFSAFAGTTFLLSWVNAGLAHESLLGTAAATGWIFGGVIQILVAFWLLRTNDLFPAVTFGAFGAFWLSFALFATLYVGNIPAGEHGHATALFLAPWAIFTLYMLIGSLKTNVAIFIAFVLVECTLVPAIIGDAIGNETLGRIGGWAGIALALVVWYVAAAEVINHQFGRVLLPLRPLA